MPAPPSARVGGKAWGLGRLIANGAPVPEGLVIGAAAFDAFLDENGLRPSIAALCAPLDASRPDEIRVAAGAIRQLVEAAPVPAGIADEIRRSAAVLLAVGPVAVRSSAVGEDGQHASFAGQLDSILHVRAGDALIDAIRTCWASYWSDRALFYRLARRAPLAGMGVIVQRQVDAAVSGVLFTHDPGASNEACRDSLLVEYCAGLGDALVSGAVDPGRVRIHRRDWSIVTLQDLPDAGRRDEVAARLTPRRLLDLARLAIRHEEACGGPQDIEWVIDRDGALWIVQSRPITTPAAAPGGRPVLWSNVNVNENFPAPISPLLYSIAATGYAHYFRNLGHAFGVSRRRMAAMDRPLTGIVGVHGARLYYNLTHVHAVLRMAPFGDALAAAFNRFVGADRVADAPADAEVFDARRGRLVQAGEAIRIAACVAWQYARLGRRVAAFERQADAFAVGTRPGVLAGRSLAALGRDLAAFIDIRRHRWTNASLADAAAMVSYAMLERQLRLAGADAASVNRLLRALPGVPSSRPPVELWALSRHITDDPVLARLFAEQDAATILRVLRTDERHTAFRQAFDRYLDRWGFRSSAELMLTVPTLEERPGPLVDLLREYARAGGEPPEAVMARQADARRLESRRLIAALAWRAPHRAFGVWRWLTWTQRAVTYRERVRLKQARLYTRVRDIARAIGARLAAVGRLHAADDVFWLTWQELDDLCDGRTMFPDGVAALVALRQTEHARLSAMSPPDTFELAETTYLPAIAGSATGPNGAGREPSRTDEGAIVSGVAASDTLTGTSACGGAVTARAALLRDVDESRLLTRGDVLVTRQTDPGWGPLFCLVSGLVIERGGMLSHGAIIAREFGLPCVVGVRDATRRIAHGATVTVDGDRGLCRILRSPEPARDEERRA